LGAGEKRYFYVGRSKDLPRRVREHRARKRTGHEDKYQFIRNLEAKGVEWLCEVIETLPCGDYAPDAERWHVIRLTREGHSLMNMRHGSAEHRKELAQQVAARHIRSIADVRTDRQRRKYESSRRLRRRINRRWISVLKYRGIPDVAADTALPPVFKRRLLAQVQVSGGGNWRVAAGWRPDEFISWLRTPLSAIRELSQLARRLGPARAPVKRDTGLSSLGKARRVPSEQAKQCARSERLRFHVDGSVGGPEGDPGAPRCKNHDQPGLSIALTFIIAGMKHCTTVPGSRSDKTLRCDRRRFRNADSHSKM